MGQLAERVGQLTDVLRQLIVRVDRLDDRVDRLVGRDLERHYRDHAAAFFQPILRRIQVVDPARLEQLADDAEHRGLLTAPEHADLLYADAVVLGRARETDAETYLLVDVSVVVDTGDVERAVRRAALLQKASSADVLAVVAGERILPEADRQARRHRVWRVLDGLANPPPT